VELFQYSSVSVLITGLSLFESSNSRRDVSCRTRTLSCSGIYFAA